MGKYAVLIGCNYPGTPSELRGPCTDVAKLAAFLDDVCKYDRVMVLVDDYTLFLPGGAAEEEAEEAAEQEEEEADSGNEAEDAEAVADEQRASGNFAAEMQEEAAQLVEHVNEEIADEDINDDAKHVLFGYPTHDNILKAINWLVNDNEPGDELFFAYSGHGGSCADDSGTEADGCMEFMCPTDDKFITDDVLNAALIRNVKPGIKLHCLIDACHSGTILDLPFQCKGDKALKQWACVEDPRFKGTSGGIAVQFSSCCDHQTSSDRGAEQGGLGTIIFLESYLAALAEEEAGGQPCTYASVFRQMQLHAKLDAKVTSAVRSVVQESESFAMRASRMKDRMWAGLQTGFAGKALGRIAGKMRTHEYTEGQVPQLAASEKIDLEMPFHL